VTTPLRLRPSRVAPAIVALALFTAATVGFAQRRAELQSDASVRPPPSGPAIAPELRDAMSQQVRGELLARRFPLDIDWGLPR
jgi:hypothetical protein